MKKRVFGIPFLGAVLAAAPLLGQMGPQIPTLAGIWNPVVGVGAVYETTRGNDNQKGQLTIAVVGKETVEGKDAFWMELITDQRGQPMVIQSLILKDGAVLKTMKIAMQMGDKPPMDMTAMMGGMMGGHTMVPSSADFREKADHVGMESVTTPAGTIEADHWKNKDGSGDAWLSPTVPPWGLVKSVSKGNSMVILKVLTDAKSHFNGKPVPFDPSAFMGPGRGQ
jgi:hypothetical protein